MSLDQTTLAPSDRARDPDEPAPLALTIAWHPDVSRIGDRAYVGGGIEVSRKGPDFGGQPLADPHLSRKPVKITATGNVARVRPHPAGSAVRVDGAPVRDMADGQVITLADRIVLVAHRAGAIPDDDLGMVGRSDVLEAVRDQVRQVADLDVAVLVRGQTGTGKEHVARAIHAAGPRSRGPFVALNMGALPPTTAAAELFGHARGAFTGADRAREGAFGRAHRGTLFLDEIGEAPAEIQVLLLRALETGEIARVGADRPVSVDVRVVAATDADLEEAVADGRFREPLLHRLAGYELTLPPLRDRREDIGLLLRHFLQEELAATGEPERLELAGPAADPWLSAELATELVLADWPGNVRQLRNTVRQLVIASRGRDRVVRTPAVDRLTRTAEQPTAAPSAAPSTGPTELSDVVVLGALRAHRFQPTAAARALGVSKTTLYAFIEQSDRIRKARDLTAGELDEAAAIDPDPSAMAAALEVSERALKLRIRELDWSA